MIYGAVTILYEFFGGHTLEFLKVVKQTTPDSYIEILRKLTAQKGLSGLLDGYLPWGLIQALFKGSVFGFAHGFCRNTLEPYTRAEVGSDSAAARNPTSKQVLSPMTSSVISGGFGGLFQGLVLSPLLLLKTRVMTDDVFRQKMSMGDTIKNSTIIGGRVIKNEGLLSLMKGSGVFSFKRVMDWSTRYMFSEFFKKVLYTDRGQYSLSLAQSMGVSILGGTASAIVTIPIDVLVAQIQQAKKAGQKVPILETFLHQFRNGGLKNLVAFSTKGFVARWLHIAFTTALMRTVAEESYQWYKRR